MVESFEAPGKTDELCIIESLENENAALRGALRLVLEKTEPWVTLEYADYGSAAVDIAQIRTIARDAIHLERQGETR